MHAAYRLDACCELINNYLPDIAGTSAVLPEAGKAIP
jgi:hypothetical protein